MTKTPAKKVTHRAELKFDELPEGWIKEDKSRLKTPTKKDPFYIELKSGYAFRSMKDVEKYIKNGNISSCLSRPILMSKEQIAALKDKNSASGSGSKPVEPASKSGSKPGRKKKGRKSSANKLTLKRKRSAAPKQDSSEPGHTEGRTATPRPKRERKTWGTPVRASPRLAGVRTPITAADQEPVDSSVVTPPADVATEVDPDADVATPVADVAVDVEPSADVAMDVEPTTQTESEPKSEAKPDPIEKSETETGQKEEVVPQTENTPAIEGLFNDQELFGSSMPGGGPGAGEELMEEKQPDGGPGAGDELMEQKKPDGGPGAGEELMEKQPGGGPGAGEDLMEEKMPGGGLGLGDELMGPPISSYFGDFWQESCLGYAFKTLTGVDGIPLDLGLETDKNVNVGPSSGPINENDNNENDNNGNENGNEGTNDDEAAGGSRDNGVAK
ncbi:hypothetical protein LUZ60_014781 [Juncus effusus]|nr:hypothetical protein LUZ60_014781 [Juncus effusus]